MNKSIMVVIGMLLPIITFSQTIYKGKIVDENKQPIIGVSVIAEENYYKGTSTDLEGMFKIKLSNSSVQLSAIGFETKKVLLTKNNTIIVLKKEIKNLEEVIISASREIQKRKEIPVSIGVLTTKQIEDTKAFGVEQLLNKISGVYMSTSMTASNEQHFMAIRSPISTKSLFLYLEDGLPIRPVAVFNHNALLEMNSTNLGRVEVVKGPASSIYGSEAIGGSINFITKNPKKEFGGSVSMEANTLGLQKMEVEASTTILDKHGFYVGAHKIQRINGLIQHSDYDKFAITFKNINNFSSTLRWTNTATFVDFSSDMGSSSLSEKNYLARKYKSNHTFTEREAKAFRFRSTLDKTWNSYNKTSFNFMYRNNEMNQIPSYRISTKSSFGEINSNRFKSYIGLIQHKLDFNFANASLIFGAILDGSSQDYYAKKIKVTYNKETEKFVDYTETDLYNLFYEAEIFNYATYMQFEISLLKNFKLTGALRYDGFLYNYDNKEEGKSGVNDQKIIYNNVSPKLGVNFNINKRSGIYANYSQGFTPPQISTLFRNNGLKGESFKLKPASFNNYEIGAYLTINPLLKADISLYRLDGRNRLITTSDNNGNFIQQNAGKTRSQGVELGLNWKIINNLTFDYSGSYATHKYLSFFKAIRNKKTKSYAKIDYSNTRMQTAPNYIGTMSLNYKPIKNLLVSLQYERIGGYHTSFENEVVVGKDAFGNTIKGTNIYDGHHLFNLKTNYTYKNFQFWAQSLNIFNTLYSIRASYRYGRNRYHVGAPIMFHFGVKYNF